MSTTGREGSWSVNVSAEDSKDLFNVSAEDSKICWCLAEGNSPRLSCQMHDACGTQRCASCGLVLDWPALAACDDGASDFGANKVEGCAEVRDGDAALRRDGVEEKLVAEHPALELPLLPAREQRQVLPREQHHAAVEEQGGFRLAA